MKMRPTVIVMTGLSGTGKSTVARVIARSLGRIRERAAQGGANSDATETIYRRRQDAADAPAVLPRNAIHVVIDTGADGPLDLDPFFAALSTGGLVESTLRKEVERSPTR